MNYLAHLALAGTEPGAMVGAVLGEFVRGRIAQGHTDPGNTAPGHMSSEQTTSGLDTHIHHGILLHRKIDVYTDAHEVTRVSRNRFQGRLRRYAGIVVDLTYDHFLATKWSSYSQLPLSDFITMVYQALTSNRASFSGRALRVVDGMCEHDWLGSYVHLDNVVDALKGVSSRLSRPNPLGDCEAALADAYEGLEADFDEFFPQLLQHCHALRHTLGIEPVSLLAEPSLVDSDREVRRA